MAVKKISTSGAHKSWDSATAYLVNAQNDPKDPVSWNLSRALNNYFHAVGTVQAAMVEGLNDLLERVDRIETKLDRRGK